MKQVKLVLVAASCLMLLAAYGWAGPGCSSSEGAKVSSSACTYGDQALKSCKSGEALGGGAEQKDKAECSASKSCKSGEALGGSADKKQASAECSVKKDSCTKKADGSPCPANCEAKGGGSDKKAAADECSAKKSCSQAKADGGKCSAACEAKGGGSDKKEAETKSACCGTGDSCCKDHKKDHKHDSSDKKACCPSKADTGKCSAECEAKGGGSDKKAAADDSAAYSIGSTIGAISLKDAASGEEKSVSSLAGEKATVLVFYNQECPFVKDVKVRLDDFNKKYSDKGVKVVAIDAGVNNDDAAIAGYAKELSFPILINKNSLVASSFGATRTPEVFIVDSSNKVLYHGAFDSGTVKGGDAPSDSYVADFVDNMLAGKANEVTQTKPFGCSLKYASGVKPK